VYPTEFSFMYTTLTKKYIFVTLLVRLV